MTEVSGFAFTKAWIGAQLAGLYGLGVASAD
jgi:hypothetical protein